MSSFYTTMQNVASTLIKQFGASITLEKEDRTPADTDKPWRGNDTTDDVSVTVDGAVVGFDDDIIDGDQIRRGDLDCWVPNVDGQNISSFDFAVIDDVRYKILSTRKIRPATTTLAYRLQLRA